MTAKSALALGAALSASLAGCATVTTGTIQAITIDSDPPAAECTVTRDGAVLGTVTTPAPLTIKRHASTVHVVCRKSGYEDGRSVMNSRFETSSAGNFLVGGLIGVMVDASTGANSRYDAAVLVRLNPMSPADQASAAAAARSQPMPAAAVPPPAATPPAAQMFTGPWTTTGVLVLERSASSCPRGSVPYSLNLTGDTLSVDNPNGHMFTATVPADGMIRQTFRSSTGGIYEMVGNARTRELEVLYNAGGCRWRLTPDGIGAAAPPLVPPTVVAALPKAEPTPQPPSPAVVPGASDFRGGLQLGALASGNSYERVSEALRDVEVHVSNGEGRERCASNAARAWAR